MASLNGIVPAGATKAQAEAAIKSMRGSLRGWLKVRQRMDDYAAGRTKPARRGAVPPSVVRQTLKRDRLAGEQSLAETLHGLLMEAGLDPASIPAPDVASDPDAAVKLARIALAGKTPSEVKAPQAQGFVWFLIAIPVAGIVLVISQMIKSKAEVQKEQEHIRCIESGACTDSGFWLKIGAITLTAWLAWDKFGLREAVKKRRK